jgi:hypothetical protein
MNKATKMAVYGGLIGHVKDFQLQSKNENVLSKGSCDHLYIKVPWFSCGE